MAAVAGSNIIAPEHHGRIVEQTDGVPLSSSMPAMINSRAIELTDDDPAQDDEL